MNGLIGSMELMEATRTDLDFLGGGFQVFNRPNQKFQLNETVDT